jgi:hypothetical protein
MSLVIEEVATSAPRGFAEDAIVNGFFDELCD